MTLYLSLEKYYLVWFWRGGQIGKFTETVGTKVGKSLGSKNKTAATILEVDKNEQEQTFRSLIRNATSNKLLESYNKNNL